VTFYFGFAMMSFASYGLVVHTGTARARHAGRYYIAMVVLGEVCVITSLMMLASQSSTDFGEMRASFTAAADTRDHLIIALLVLGFGVKAGLAGLHFWLPLAHPVAPAPASAVLSGAMIKAGLVAWMRFLPLGELALPAWGAGLAVLGMFTACYAVVVGLPQREAKTVLAYSSVSQMGIMTLAIGIGLAYPERWPLAQAALLVYIVHHGLVKGSLFLGAGMVHDALAPWLARIMAVVFCLAAWSMAGGPFSGGLAAKLGVKAALPAAGAWHDILPPLLTFSSVLTALLLLRFLWLAWPRGCRCASRQPGCCWRSRPWRRRGGWLRRRSAPRSCLWRMRCMPHGRRQSPSLWRWRPGPCLGVRDANGTRSCRPGMSVSRSNGRCWRSDTASVKCCAPTCRGAWRSCGHSGASWSGAFSRVRVRSGAWKRGSLPGR
jgi:formate hydrogenlyase subunit 3/multisubunit Na+/H+ antiporter MnhD subunit